MAAFRRLDILFQLLRFARAAASGVARTPGAAPAELWCRPATVIALRDPARAPSCVAGWR